MLGPQRYVRIKWAPEQKLPAIAASRIYVDKTFKDFIVPFQARQPMIAVLYQKTLTLVEDLLSRFILVDTFCKQFGTLKSFKKLCDLDLKDSSIQNGFNNSSLPKNENEWQNFDKIDISDFSYFFL